jgi:hypothetical protein
MNERIPLTKPLLFSQSSFERSEAGGLGVCPHEREIQRENDAPLALRGPLPWRPFFLVYLLPVSLFKSHDQ